MSLDAYAQELSASLAKAGLVPGSAPLIPDNFTPSTQLTIKFGEKAVELGNLFRASECKGAPSVDFTPEEGVDGSKRYMLFLIDPDAPTPDDPKFAYWRHWVVSGLAPGQGMDSGKVLTEYLGPGPKDESKPHRYLYLLFREPEGLSLQKSDVGGEEFVERRSFKAAEFVDTLKLELVGVNWMLGAGGGWTA